METVRSYLQDELIRRCRTNPRYSLRSFAKHLQMNPSLLSKILRGQVGVSRKRFDKICERMALGPGERSQLALAQDQTRTFRRRDLQVREMKSTSTQMREMADRFQVIADWYHHAILELVSVDGFQSDERWIAKTLAISYSEVSQARERLVRLGMLEVDASGQWKNVSGCDSGGVSGCDSGGVTESNGRYNSIAVRKLQAQVLNLALGALETVQAERRLQQSATVAIDAELVLAAKEKITAFQIALAASLQAESRTKNSVYQISFSFFPVTT